MTLQLDCVCDTMNRGFAMSCAQRITLSILFCVSLIPELSADVSRSGAGGATSVSGITYYVSTSGNDDHPGTSPELAWRTLLRPNQTHFKAGDTLAFEADSTFSGSLVVEPPRCGTDPEHPLRITSFGNGRATIEAENNTGLFISNCGAIEISKLKITGSGYRTNNGRGIYFRNTSDKTLRHIVVDEVEVSGFGRGGITFGYPCDPVRGKTTCTVASPDMALGHAGYQKVRITRNHVHNNGDHGIATYGIFTPLRQRFGHRDLTISRNTVHHNHGDPQITHTHTGNGIVLSNVDGAIVEFNEVFSNGKENTYPHGGPVGIWAWDSNNVTFQYNESYDNRSQGGDGGGFDFDGGVTNSIMQYNYSHDNDGAGFLVYQFDHAPRMEKIVVRYNISEHDGRKGYAGIASVGYLCRWRTEPCDWSTAHDISIYNNTVVTRNPGRKKTPALKIRGAAFKGLTVRNNIFFVTGIDTPVVDVGKKSNVILQGNNYHSLGVASIKFSGKVFYDLATWRRSTGQETLHGKPTGVMGAPGLRGPGRGGTLGPAGERKELDAYKLTSSSPLINMGLDLKKLFQLDTGHRDFYGTPIPSDGAYEIGAFEQPYP